MPQLIKFGFLLVFSLPFQCPVREAYNPKYRFSKGHTLPPVLPFHFDSLSPERQALSPRMAFATPPLRPPLPFGQRHLLLKLQDVHSALPYCTMSSGKFPTPDFSLSFSLRGSGTNFVSFLPRSLAVVSDSFPPPIPRVSLPISHHFPSFPRRP